MAWIESHQALGNHPKVEKLARILKIHRAQAIGHLHLLWWWCLDYAPEGDLVNLSPEDIAAAAGWTKNAGVFIEAMVSCGIVGDGFLERTDSGFRVHDWYQYGGRLIERRRAEYERLKRNRDAARSAHYSRLRAAADTQGDTPYHTPSDTGDDTHGVGGTVPTVPIPPISPPRVQAVRKRSRPGPADPSFDAFWALYPKKAGRADAVKAWAKLDPADREKALAAVRLYATAMAGRLEFVKHPQGWLNGRRFEDDPKSWGGANGAGRPTAAPAIDPARNRELAAKAGRIPEPVRYDPDDEPAELFPKGATA
jgi:hypothetical protein